MLKQRYGCEHEKHIYCVFSNIDSIEQFLRKNIFKKSRSSFVHHFERQQDGGAELSNIISNT